MITKDQIKAFFALLVILFSLEDVIGNNKLMILEAKWLRISATTFYSWKIWFGNSLFWWGYIILYSILIIFPLLLVIAGIGLPIWFLSKSDILENELCGGLTFIFLEIFISFIAWIVLIGINNFFSNMSSTDDPPLEIRILRKLSQFGEWYPTVYMNTPGVSGPEGVLLITVLLSGILVPIISITLIGLRCIFLVATLAIWIVFFGPPNLFQAIAKKTGASSFIKVGKYLFSIVGYILTYVY